MSRTRRRNNLSVPDMGKGTRRIAHRKARRRFSRNGPFTNRDYNATLLLYDIKGLNKEMGEPSIVKEGMGGAYWRRRRKSRRNRAFKRDVIDRRRAAREKEERRWRHWREE